MNIKVLKRQAAEDEMYKKIKSHKRKILIIIFVALSIITAVVVGIYIYYKGKTYTSYDVIHKVAREDSVGSKFIEFKGNILKYSNDGAFFIDISNQLIWNQSFEMQDPIVDICEEYAVIADRNGRQIFVADTKGTYEKIVTKMPIQQVHVANQGAFVVFMEEGGTGYIQLFDKNGKQLGNGTVGANNNRYLLDVSVSNDCTRVAVSYLVIEETGTQTAISFYNFSSAGQNETDRMVSSYSYADTIIGKIEFLTNDEAVAFGLDQILIFEGSKKPVQKKEIKIDREIQSVFYNSHYFGVTYKKETNNNSYEMNIYNLSGSKVQTIDFDMNYDNIEIEFLQNDEICVKNDYECVLYTLRGVEKFRYNFKRPIHKVLSTKSMRNYILLLEGTTEKIRLK